METKSSLTIKRILMTNLLFFSMPTLAKLFNILINDINISYTLVISLVGFINITYNWDLFALHYNRAKKNIIDSIFFFIIGIILMSILTYLNQKYIRGYILTIDLNTLNNYSISLLLMTICFSFVLPFNIMISFKCFVDRIKLDATTLQVILFSGLLFGLLFTIFYSPFNISIILPSLLYYSILFIISSYLYNQTGTIFISLLSYSFILLYINLLNLI